MPEATITLTMHVTLNVPEEYAGKVSRDDLIEMARSAVPDSGTTPNGLPNGVQVTLDSTCQEEDGQPVFADVVHVEHDQMEEPYIDFSEEGFKKADPDEED